MADARARTGTRPQAFVGDGHAPIGTDFEQGAAAPDIRPPGAERDWAQDAALVALGGARGGAGRAEARWRIRGWCWLRRRRAPVGGPASIDAGVRFCPGPGACARSARRRRKRGGRPRVGSALRCRWASPERGRRRRCPVSRTVRVDGRRRADSRRGVRRNVCEPARVSPPRRKAARGARIKGANRRWES